MSNIGNLHNYLELYQQIYTKVERYIDFKYIV